MGLKIKNVAGDSNSSSNLRTTDLDNHFTLLLGFPSANMSVIAMEMYYNIVHMQLSLIFREQNDLDKRTPCIIPTSLAVSLRPRPPVH